jgi:hypothetical protein
MIYAEMLNSALGKAEFTLEREVARRECSRGDSAQLERKDHKPSFVSASMNRLVAPDSLIPTDGKLKALAMSTDTRNVPMLTTLEMSPFRRKGNVRF